MSGTLYVVGTPIGNLEDITLRALRILTSVEVIVCEDTRVTQRLLDHLKKQTPSTAKQLLVRSDEHTQLKMIPKIMKWLDTDTDVALVTDAGMPTISDPGWRVVDALRDAGYHVEVVPGPTALTTALAGSGIDASKVWFVGFLPKKDKHRQEIYTEMLRQLSADASTAIVFYESPQRIRGVLAELITIAPNLKAAACGELTKLHEKIIRGTIEEVLQHLPVEVRGEWVVVVGR